MVPADRGSQRLPDGIEAELQLCHSSATGCGCSMGTTEHFRPQKKGRDHERAAAHENNHLSPVRAAAQDHPGRHGRGDGTGADRRRAGRSPRSGEDSSDGSDRGCASRGCHPLHRPPEQPQRIIRQRRFLIADRRHRHTVVGHHRPPEEQTQATPADEQESTGVVLIDTQLGFEKAEAAGTGIVLSKDGLVLTNNHVIADSTKIAVTVATTGKTYTANVVGSDSTEDVAVLQLEDAEDLQTATIDDDTVDVGDDVTAVGNSEGGGRLMAAEGTITDLGASVTTTAKGTEDSETLDDMIQVQADIVSGDSGGALLDDEGEVVGMDT